MAVRAGSDSKGVDGPGRLIGPGRFCFWDFWEEEISSLLLSCRLSCAIPFHRCGHQKEDTGQWIRQAAVPGCITPSDSHTDTRTDETIRGCLMARQQCRARDPSNTIQIRLNHRYWPGSSAAPRGYTNRYQVARQQCRTTRCMELLRDARIRFRRFNAFKRCSAPFPMLCGVRC